MDRIRARDIMSTPVVFVPPSTTVAEIVREMRRHGISGIPVTQDRRLVGIITESDILAKEVGVGGLPDLDYLASRKRAEAIKRRGAYRASDLMTADVITAQETDTVREVGRLMIRHGFNHIPIVRDAELVGIVTRSDVIGVFERPSRAVLADVRRALREDVPIDPDRLDVVVRDGVVTVIGPVEDPADTRIIETVLADIDGVVAVDTAGLAPSRIGSA